MSVVLYLGLIEGLQPGNEKYPGKTDKISKTLKKCKSILLAPSALDNFLFILSTFALASYNLVGTLALTNMLLVHQKQRKHFGTTKKTCFFKKEYDERPGKHLELSLKNLEKT